MIIHQLSNDDVAGSQEMNVDEDVEDDGLAEDDYEPLETAAVPDLRTNNDELTELRAELARTGATRQVGRQPRRLPSMSLPTPQNTPLSEFNKTHPLLSWAFPSLFPRGQAEFVSSRLRDVDYKKYIRHLLLHKSARFAQHPRFRYVVFNTVMRMQVNTKAGFFVQKMHPEHKDLTVEDLRAAFDDDTEESEKMLQSITRYAAQLRGTRPYWNGRMRALEALCRQLLCSHAFLTFTPADYHWDSLQRHLPEYHSRWQPGDQKQRLRLVRDNVRDNPMVVAYHFHRRLEVFFQTVLFPKFNIVDHCHCYEWQARGSSHSHGLYWIDGIPNPGQLTDIMGNLNEEVCDHLAQF
jgi:ATP-dependent DNA helicase PIF1